MGSKGCYALLFTTCFLPCPVPLPLRVSSRAASTSTNATSSGGAASAGSNPTVRELDFVVSRYSLNGTWLGLEALTWQFQLCGGKWSTLHSWRYFGLSTLNNCTLAFEKMLELAAREGGTFYDIYLRDGQNRWARTGTHRLTSSVQPLPLGMVLVSVVL